VKKTMHKHRFFAVGVGYFILYGGRENEHVKLGEAHSDKMFKLANTSRKKFQLTLDVLFKFSMNTFFETCDQHLCTLTHKNGTKQLNRQNSSIRTFLEMHEEDWLKETFLS